MSQPNPSTAYVMGHDDRERRRLALQASIINPITERLLARAGIAAGMRVLDAGCGVGEVSILAARLVGRHGEVAGVDIDEPALAIARRKAQEAGLSQVKFVHGDIGAYRPSGRVDAVIGRHILIHTPNPLGLLETAFSILRSGGVTVFQEFDFDVVHRSYPESPLRERTFEIFRKFFGAAGHGNIGSRLYHLFAEAGFAHPECYAEYPVDGGADSPFYEWFAESLRSILARAEALGLARSEDVQIDTLAERLRADCIALQSNFPAPAMIGCFGRKP